MVFFRRSKMSCWLGNIRMDVYQAAIIWMLCSFGSTEDLRTWLEKNLFCFFNLSWFLFVDGRNVRKIPHNSMPCRTYGVLGGNQVMWNCYSPPNCKTLSFPPLLRNVTNASHACRLFLLLASDPLYYLLCATTTQVGFPQSLTYSCGRLELSALAVHDSDVPYLSPCTIYRRPVRLGMP